MLHRLIPHIALILVTGQTHGETKAILDLKQLPQAGETLVWSPLFQASWDKLNKIHGGIPLKVDPPNPLITTLDQFKWDPEKVMPEGGYAVFAGPATAEFTKATEAEIKKKFGVTMTPSRLPNSAGGLALFGILTRDLSFQKTFFRSRKHPLEFKDSEGKNHKVKFFGSLGSHSDNYGSSVETLAYNAQDSSFILQLATDQKEEDLIIYRPQKPTSFETAIQQVLAAKAKPLAGQYGSLTDGTLHKNDTVKIPYLTLKSETFFTDQLQGARTYPKEPEPRQITMAYQVTHFELFEKGARLRVETGTSDDPFGSAPKTKKIYYVPRAFICDKPFYVFSWKKDALLPYFAAWIDGKEALQPFPEN